MDPETGPARTVPSVAAWQPQRGPVAPSAPVVPSAAPVAGQAVAGRLVPVGGGGFDERELGRVNRVIRDRLAGELGTRTRPGCRGERVARVWLLRECLDDASFAVVLHWLASARRGAVATKRAYADDLLGLCRWLQARTGPGPVPLLARLHHVTVTEWTVWARGEGLAVRTQRRMLSTVSSLFGYAIARGMNITNPVRFEDHAPAVGTSTTGRRPGATKTLEREQLVALLDAATDATERFVLHLLAVQGLRESEVVAIRVEQIDLTGVAPVVPTARKRGQWVNRRVTGSAADDLHTLIDGRVDGPLLVNGRGEPADRHWVINLVRRVTRHAKHANGWDRVPTVTPHVLRGSAITLLLDAGKPLQEVQQWAGHTHSTTTQGYWNRKNEVDRDAALSAAISTSLDEARSGITTATKQ